MKYFKTVMLLAPLFVAQTLLAQDDLLKGLEDKNPSKEYISNAFKSSRVINAHSMEMIGAGSMDFRILHRFGPVSQGIGDLFGLDQASMRLGFDFGLTKNLTIGIGRTTFKKELDGFLKYRFIQQSTGVKASPVSLVGVAGLSVYTFKSPDPTKPIPFNDRVGSYFQLIVGRKFSNNFTLQISPTLVHRNVVAANDENDILALGFGARYKFTKRMAFVVDYSYVANGLPKTTGANPLSLGVDIETGGHVFQLHFSNSTGMNERSFITETTNTWGSGEVRFGFNLSRIFDIKKSKK
jgi:Membrane bound beta barrel domain (DUF5777)